MSRVRGGIEDLEEEEDGENKLSISASICVNFYFYIFGYFSG